MLKYVVRHCSSGWSCRTAPGFGRHLAKHHCRIAPALQRIFAVLRLDAVRVGQPQLLLDGWVVGCGPARMARACSGDQLYLAATVSE